MKQYRLNWRYFASYRDTVIGGAEGDVLELDDETSAFIERDSPGALSPIETVLRTLEKPAQDRMVKSAATRRKDRAEDASDQGTIDKKTFKAVRNA